MHTHTTSNQILNRVYSIYSYKDVYSWFTLTF